MKFLIIPVFCWFTAVCHAQILPSVSVHSSKPATASDLIQSDLIRLVFPVDGSPVPVNGAFVIRVPSGLAISIDPKPIFTMKSTEEGTGASLTMVMQAQQPGYTIRVDHAVVHPTPAELDAAPTDDKAKFKAWLLAHSRDEIYSDSLTVKVGAGPGPGPNPPGPDPPVPPEPEPDNPAPIPEPGFRVMVIYEKEGKKPESLRSILAGREVAEYLGKACVTEPNNWAGYRFVDQHQDLTDDPQAEIWGKALARKRDSLPWLIISNGTTGYEGPLPQSVPAFLELCKKYEAK